MQAESRELPNRGGNVPADPKKVAEMADTIEREMRSIGAWQAAPLSPEQYEFKEAFAMDTMAYVQWLQFVFLPRVRSLVESGGPFPSRSQVGVHAVREFDGQPEASGLSSLLCRFDDLFNS